MKSVIDILGGRCLLEEMTDEKVREFLESPRVVYAGFDPTSDSLQVGNLVTIMALAHLLKAGHRIIALVGGATGMIGDPSGKSSERNLLSEDQIRLNEEGVRENLTRILGRCGDVSSVTVLNNNDWLSKYSFIDFLRDIGKHFRMGAMLGKESVRSRLSSEAGMSFAEFSYQLLQAYDFLELYDREKCCLQIGGSDQWGNITAGTDLVRRLRGADVYGFTIPLLCDGSGQKFGKSEGNAVFLDEKKTSCYEFYQFFFRAEDGDVIKLLKVFTFLSLDKIESYAVELKKNPDERLAQRKLAEEVTRLVHGQEGLDKAMAASKVLFGGAIDGVRSDELLSIFADVPSAELSSDRVNGVVVVDLAVSSGMCRSKGEARRLIESGGLYVNNRRVESIDEKVIAAQIIDGRVVVLRSGKKNFYLVRIVGS